jgi:hypothetical protein
MNGGMGDHIHHMNGGMGDPMNGNIHHMNGGMGDHMNGNIHHMNGMMLLDPNGVPHQIEHMEHQQMQHPHQHQHPMMWSPSSAHSPSSGMMGGGMPFGMSDGAPVGMQMQGGGLPMQASMQQNGNGGGQPMFPGAFPMFDVHMGMNAHPGEHSSNGPPLAPMASHHSGGPGGFMQP